MPTSIATIREMRKLVFVSNSEPKRTLSSIDSRVRTRAREWWNTDVCLRTVVWLYREWELALTLMRYTTMDVHLRNARPYVRLDNEVCNAIFVELRRIYTRARYDMYLRDGEWQVLDMIVDTALILRHQLITRTQKRMKRAVSIRHSRPKCLRTYAEAKRALKSIICQYECPEPKYGGEAQDSDEEQELSTRVPSNSMPRDLKKKQGRDARLPLKRKRRLCLKSRSRSLVMRIGK
jgi:hypothetical protein